MQARDPLDLTPEGHGLDVRSVPKDGAPAMRADLAQLHRLPASGDRAGRAPATGKIDRLELPCARVALDEPGYGCHAVSGHERKLFLRDGEDAPVRLAGSAEIEDAELHSVDVLLNDCVR